MSTTRASIIIDASTERAIAEFQKLKGMIGGMGDAFDMIKGAAAALGGVLSVSAFAGWIKGAIDAADEMSDLSQRTGLAVKDIGGLQIAFKMGGMSADALQGNMSKLNRGIADGSAAFEAMGLSTRNADGSLKSTRQMLGEVADKFAGYKDGAEKSALAMDIFGKSGADMIPLLNQGSKGLADFDERARQLGLVLDDSVVDQAGAFNDTLDLINMGAKGVATQVAAQLLPTLSGLAGQFFDTMTSGDKLNTVANFLSGGLKGLYVVALGVGEAFSTVGKIFGSAAGQIAAMLSGDFKLAAQIGKEAGADIRTSWLDTAQKMDAAWNTTGDTVVEALAKAKRQADENKKSLAPLTKATEDATKASKAWAKELEDGMKEALEWRKKELKALDEMWAAVDRLDKQELASLETARQSYAQLVEQNDQLKLEIQMIGLDETARRALLRVKQEEALADKELELLSVIYNNGSSEKINLLEREILLRKQNLALTQNRDVAMANDALRQNELAAWEKTYGQISQSFVDALMQGGKSVKEYLIGLFRTMVLRPILAPVGSAVSGIMGSLMPGGSAMAGTGGGATDLLGSLGGLGDLGSLLGNTGMGALDIGGFSLGGMGSFLGYAGLALGAIKLLKSFKRPGEQHTGGYYSSSGLEANMDNAMALTGGGGDGAYARDLIKRANPGIKTLVGTTVDSVLKATQAQAKALGFDISLGIDAGLAANTNGKGKNKNTFGYFNITSGGDVVSEYSNRELGPDFGEATAKFAADMAEAAAKVVLAGTDFQKAGETAVQTLQRLSQIQGMSEALNPLGGIFSAIANSSVAARDHLIGLAGGIDQLTAQASAFVKDYYSQGEQVGIQAKSIVDALAAVGISADLLTARDEFRALVESRNNLEDPLQREQLAALLQLGPSFAQLTDYLKQNDMTLGQAAALAPDVPILQSMLDPQEKTAQATQNIASGVQASNTLLGEIKGQLSSVSAASERAAAAAVSAAAAASAAVEAARLSASRPANGYDIGGYA